MERDEIGAILGPAIDGGRVDVNGIVRDVLEVARVGLGEGMPEAPEAEVRALLAAALAVIARTMPEELQRRDRRVLEARALSIVLGMAGPAPGRARLQ